MTEPVCKMVLLTQAEFDGELDAAHAAELSAHRETCAECQEAYATLNRVRGAIHGAGLHQRAPDALRQRLSALAPTKPAPAQAQVIRPRQWARPALSFAVGAALAASIAIVTLDTGQSGMIDQVVDDHVRALQAGHLQDVESTDRHTVKPWFEGRIDFAPPVKDLAAQKFPLTGGRLDFLNGRPIAAMVYRGGTHPINLLVWPTEANDTPNPVSANRNGFTAIHWTQNGMTLWAVSDLEREQLEEFVRLWRIAP